MLANLAIAVSVAAIAAAALAPLVIAGGVTDVPDVERKIHKEPTPTSGGMAIGAGFALGLALALVFTDVARTANFDRFIVPAISCACAFALAALVLGLLDDIMALPPRAKFVIMALLGIGVALLVARAEDMPMFGRWTIHLGVVAGVLGTALWVFVMMNATNFMDGTNGLAMGSSAISLAALALEFT